jgi:Reverse transcriptase (RNA-dependent DNA polymerase)
VVSFAAAHGWDIQSHDVTKAYVQGEILQREIYMVPPKELKLEPNKMLKIIKTFYGLTDAGDILYETLVRFLRERLK